MFKMYFLPAFRSLIRNKNYTLLNIAGLALGISCSILLFLVVKYQLSYDTFHSKADHVYRVNVDFTTVDYKNPGAHYPLADLIRSNGNLSFEAVTQIQGEGSAQINIINNDNKTVKKLIEEQPIVFAEPSIFDVFDFGVPANKALSSYLEEPNNVILTESIAEKYFPDEDPVGKMIRYNNRYNLKVVATMPDVPHHSEYPFIMLISYKTVENTLPNDWGNLSSSHQVFVVVPEGMKASAAEANLNELFQQLSPDEHVKNAQTYVLQPLKDIHYNLAYYGGVAQTVVTKEIIYGMVAVGFILLLTACINFINLATAQALKRAREVGVRKVLGSSQLQLIVQLLCETFVVVLFATFLSVILAELALPFLNELLELDITFSLLQDQTLFHFLILQTLLVTLFAGFYPAFVLSSFQPITAIKSRVNLHQVGGISLRQVLVVLQFTICQVLIICTILVNEQMEYFKSKSMGFDREAVVTVMLPRQGNFQAQTLRQELLKNPTIKEASFASDAPSSYNISLSNFYFDKATEDEEYQAHKKFVDAAFFNLYNIPFVAGKRYADNDSVKYMIINETLRRKLGLLTAEDAIGKEISLGGGSDFRGPIIGVVADFHQSSLSLPIEPLILTRNPADYGLLSVKINLNQKQEALAHLEKVWDMAYPDDVFNYKFLDDSIAEFYKDEEKQSKLFKIFSLISILIGCLGLYGLVSFMAAQRTKEVGVRKVLGASVFNITLLFSKEFIKLVLIAFVVAVPIAYYLMSLWLQDFTYRISLGFGAFILAGIATLTIALLTMSTQAIKAALTNPVISLKSE